MRSVTFDRRALLGIISTSIGVVTLALFGFSGTEIGVFVAGAFIGSLRYG